MSNINKIYITDEEIKQIKTEFNEDIKKDLDEIKNMFNILNTMLDLSNKENEDLKNKLENKNMNIKKRKLEN